MPVYVDPREREAIMAIIDELRDYYIDKDIDNDHFIELVASEAKRHGIRPSISAPFARQMLESVE